MIFCVEIKIEFIVSGRRFSTLFFVFYFFFYGFSHTLSANRLCTPPLVFLADYIGVSELHVMKIFSRQKSIQDHDDDRVDVYR